MNIKNMVSDRPRMEKLLRFISDAIKSKRNYSIPDLENYFGVTNRSAYRIFYFLQLMGEQDLGFFKVDANTEAMTLRVKK